MYNYQNVLPSLLRWSDTGWYDCGKRGFGVNKDKPVDRVWGKGSKEMLQNPIQSIYAVFAVVKTSHYHLLLGGRHRNWSTSLFFLVKSRVLVIICQEEDEGRRQCALKIRTQTWLYIYKKEYRSYANWKSLKELKFINSQVVLQRVPSVGVRSCIHWNLSNSSTYYFLTYQGVLYFS